MKELKCIHRIQRLLNLFLPFLAFFLVISGRPVLWTSFSSKGDKNFKFMLSCTSRYYSVSWILSSFSPQIWEHPHMPPILINFYFHFTGIMFKIKINIKNVGFACIYNLNLYALKIIFIQLAWYSCFLLIFSDLPVESSWLSDWLYKNIFYPSSFLNQFSATLVIFKIMALQKM